MSNRKTSIIWKLSKNDFQLFIKECSSKVEVLERLGLDPYNGNHKTLNRRIKEDCIDISHIIENNKNERSEIRLRTIIPLSEILIESSIYANKTRLKNRLIKETLLFDKCYECGIGSYWNKKPLSLQLDHINGINNDNRIDNLRLLCPNCHTQTTTFAGRNAKTNKHNKCIDCYKDISNHNERCQSCSGKERRNKNTKIIWPNNEELIIMLNSSNFSQMAKILGVSNTSVRKRMIKNGLIKASK